MKESDEVTVNFYAIGRRFLIAIFDIIDAMDFLDFRCLKMSKISLKEIRSSKLRPGLPKLLLEEYKYS